MYEFTICWTHGRAEVKLFDSVQDGYNWLDKTRHDYDSFIVRFLKTSADVPTIS